MKANPTTCRTTRPGFTLVELLVVITIIVLLVTLIGPALTGMMNMAKSTKTRAMITVLDTGLKQFIAEPALERQYPPSYCDTGANPPPSYLPNRGNQPVAYGANTLVWALMGLSDRLAGTAGFPDSGTLQDFYEPAAPAASPTLYGPFVDKDKVSVGPPHPGPNTPFRSINNPNPFWAILDPWENPILYYRADPTQANAGVYNWLHNEGFLRQQIGGQDMDKVYDQDTFRLYTHDYRAGGDPKLDTDYVPQNRDTFLLISAGPDGRYGTGDDVTNFNPKGL